MNDLTEFVFDIVFDGFSLINRILNHFSNPSYNNSMDGGCLNRIINGLKLHEKIK